MLSFVKEIIPVIETRVTITAEKEKTNKKNNKFIRTCQANIQLSSNKSKILETNFPSLLVVATLHKPTTTEVVTNENLAQIFT